MLISLTSIQVNARPLHTEQVPRHLARPISTMPFPKSIQALAINQAGDVDVIHKEAVPFPEHVPGNIVIKVCKSTT